ncbi:MAG: YpdA family putative bacillithiol disulfide reductase [Gemmatimonadaceae bacterium]|nr:YpdA family putative bacillithiol disulfide reductase [Gemmatimonadaceae bacterium]
MAVSPEESVDVAIVGAGPCGLAAAVTMLRAEMSCLVFDGGAVTSTITAYPTYVSFFSTAEKLSIGGLPFTIGGEKPGRRDALAYYRSVVKYFGIPVRQFEKVTAVMGSEGNFIVQTQRRGGEIRAVRAKYVIVATGYFGSPNRLNVPGETLEHVSHVYKEGHEAFDQDAVVVGGGNSAAEAALDLWRSGARVTLVHFGPTFDMKIKPWILPDVQNRMKEGNIAVRWNSRVRAISAHSVTIDTQGVSSTLPADRVYVMTGFAPNVDLLRQIGVSIDRKSGVPAHDDVTLETDVPGVFIAGVVVAGFDANKVFIENGRFHGEKILAHILGRAAPAEPVLSADLDS